MKIAKLNYEYVNIFNRFYTLNARILDKIKNKYILLLIFVFILFISFSFDYIQSVFPFLHDPGYFDLDATVQRYKVESEVPDTDNYEFEEFLSGSNFVEIPAGRVPHYPTKSHLLGTDSKGRDLLSRILAGVKIYFYPLSLIGLFFPSLIIGTMIGISTGYFIKFKKLNKALSIWIIRPINSFPKIVVIFLFLAISKINIVYILTIVGFLNIPRVADAIRIKFLSFRKEKFIEACKALGLTNKTIIFKHILWYNCRAVYLLLATQILAEAIIIETSLAYLNYGDLSSWGNIVSFDSPQIYMVIKGAGYPLITILGMLASPTLPAIAIILFILLLYNLGDTWAKEVDPKRRKASN